MPALLAMAASALFAGRFIFPPAELRTRVESAPKSVEAFIVRRAGCNHFLGEYPYDEERAAELNRAIRQLRCSALTGDERRLRRKYRENSAVLLLLDEARDILGW